MVLNADKLRETRRVLMDRLNGAPDPMPPDLEAMLPPWGEGEEQAWIERQIKEIDMWLAALMGLKKETGRGDQ
jgi:hypothetical protein